MRAVRVVSVGDTSGRRRIFHRPAVITFTAGVRVAARQAVREALDDILGDS